MNEFGEPALGGWWVGLSIGFVLVLVVVVVVGVLLALASRIGSQVREAVASLDVARSATLSLSELHRTNDTLRSILGGAVTAREALEGEQ